MKKNLIVVVMVCIAMILATGCGKREQSAKANSEVADGSQTFPAFDENVITLTTQFDTATEKSNEVELEDYQVLISVPELIQTLEEEPEWSMDHFGSMDSFKNFCSSMRISKEITDIYDEHKANGKLNDEGEVEFWSNEEDYISYGPSFVIYQEDGTYRMRFVFETDNAKEVIGQGCFRNGDKLVLISALTYSNNTVGYLPELYSKFCRREISNEGTISEISEYMDTALLRDRKFKKVMVCPEFTVLFYPATNEFLCVKDSEAIGPRTEVASIDLKGLERKGITPLAIVNKENTLVYPVIIKEGESTSFELLHVGKVDHLASYYSMPQWGTIKGIRYPVVNENTIYYVNEATKPNDTISYAAYGLTDDLDWIVSTRPIVVNDAPAIVKQYDIDYQDFQQYELTDGAGGCIYVKATYNDMEIYGTIASPDDCIRKAQEEGKFSEYRIEYETYKIPTYSETQKVLKELGIHVE